MREIRLLFVVIAMLMAIGSTVACSSDPTPGPLRSRERTLVLKGDGVRVADAPVELQKLGVKWLEARMRLLSATTDRKGVVSSTPDRRIGVAMDYVGHASDGSPVLAGAIALDVAGLARLRWQSTGGEIATVLQGSPAVRLRRRAGAPKPPFTHAERATIVRGVVDAFLDGGKKPKDAGVETSSVGPRGFDFTTTLRPCADEGSGGGSSDFRDEPSEDTCVDGTLPPDGCFHPVCDIEDADLMEQFTKVFKSTLQGAYKNKKCIAFMFTVGASAVDTAIVLDGPVEVLLAGGAAALGRQCALSLVESLITGLAKKELLGLLKNILCSSRDATLPALPELELDASDRVVVDVLNRIGVIPSGGKVTSNYSAVQDVFNTVRACTCGVASMTDPEVAAGTEPVRGQRVVNAEGEIACVPCASGSHYDAEKIECVPDNEGDIIAVCTDGGDAAVRTPCGEAGVEVRVIKPELCVDAWVTRYTGEQAQNGTIPEPELVTITIPAPQNGGSWRDAGDLHFRPSYDACGTTDGYSRLVEATDEDDGPEDGLDYGAIRATASGDTDGFVGYYALLSPFPDANGNENLFPGHSCAKDASGVTHCIDVVLAEYHAHGPSDVYVSPGFYWCDFKGSQCRDSKQGGRSVPPAGTAPTYFVIGQGTDTCTVTPEGPPNGPPRGDSHVDSCDGKSDGVYCSAIEGNQGAGYRCKAGKRAAYTQCGIPGEVCLPTANADQIVCGQPVLSKTDCGDKTDGWWCLDQGTGEGWMAYCAGKQIAGGCSCGSCSTAGVAAACSAPAPPAACPS